jgi:RNA 2',3'-cyclic 3'-phosphodiesterase
MKRLFAALKINPDADFLGKYRELQKTLSPELIKWVEDRNIHVTLKFFGETDERAIPGISDVLLKRASITPCITMNLSGLGIFGSSYAPKVVWVGIEPYAELSELMKNIHLDLKSVGYEPDRQNLVPHLTLGRIKFLRDKILFNRTIGQYKTISSSSFFIREVVLYESILHRDGPEYIALDKFPLLKKELP